MAMEPGQKAVVVANKIADDEPAIEATRLCRTFDAIVAVDDVSFAMTPGEILGGVGESGAGKSMVANALNGSTA